MQTWSTVNKGVTGELRKDDGGIQGLQAGLSLRYVFDQNWVTIVLCLACLVPHTDALICPHNV